MGGLCVVVLAHENSQVQPFQDDFASDMSHADAFKVRNHKIINIIWTLSFCSGCGCVCVGGGRHNKIFELLSLAALKPRWFLEITTPKLQTKRKQARHPRLAALPPMLLPKRCDAHASWAVVWRGEWWEEGCALFRVSGDVGGWGGEVPACFCTLSRPGRSDISLAWRLRGLRFPAWALAAAEILTNETTRLQFGLHGIYNLHPEIWPTEIPGVSQSTLGWSHRGGGLASGI